MVLLRSKAIMVLLGFVLLSPLVNSVNAEQASIAEEITFVRHGQSEDNLDAGQLVVSLSGKTYTSRGKALSGWNSASLTMQGVSEAVQAGELLKALDESSLVPLKDSKWVYSPLLRAEQTLAGVMLGAGLINQIEQLSVIPDTRLMERSAGFLTSLTWIEASKIWPELKKGKEAPVFTNVSFSYPNGESLSDVYRRSAEAIDEHARTHRRVIFVSHELTIKAMLAHLLTGTINDSAFDYEVQNAKPITLRMIDGRWRTTDGNGT